jgi:hypothetical protein
LSTNGSGFSSSSEASAVKGVVVKVVERYVHDNITTAFCSKKKKKKGKREKENSVGGTQQEKSN